jgi:hypothetical protein
MTGFTALVDPKSNIHHSLGMLLDVQHVVDTLKRGSYAFPCPFEHLEHWMGCVEEFDLITLDLFMR